MPYRNVISVMCSKTSNVQHIMKHVLGMQRPVICLCSVPSWTKNKVKLPQNLILNRMQAVASVNAKLDMVQLARLCGLSTVS